MIEGSKELMIRSTRDLGDAIAVLFGAIAVHNIPWIKRGKGLFLAFNSRKFVWLSVRKTIEFYRFVVTNPVLPPSSDYT